MKITIILLAITVSCAVAFPSGLSDLVGSVPILRGIFGGGDQKNHGNNCNHGKGGIDKHISQVCMFKQFFLSHSQIE